MTTRTFKLCAFLSPCSWKSLFARELPSLMVWHISMKIPSICPRSITIKWKLTSNHILWNVISVYADVLWRPLLLIWSLPAQQVMNTRKMIVKQEPHYQLHNQPSVNCSCAKTIAVSSLRMQVHLIHQKTLPLCSMCFNCCEKNWF